MQLCLDVGNSHILGGVFLAEKLLVTFRHDTKQASSADQIGLFIKLVLRENKLNPDKIKQIAFCSVVPALDYTLRSACIKYFDIIPFELKAGVKTGLKIKYHSPLEVGADRIANAIAARHQFPNKPLLIVDFGTATTCCAVTAQGEYWGGAIFPGMRLAMESLQQNTSKLFPVEILQPTQAVGQSTRESIQAGLYYMQLGAVKEIMLRFNQELFRQEKCTMLATGGFAHLFAQEELFHVIVPDLVLRGLQIALKLNPS
jgi:type III pantothenate kinase